MEKKAKVAIVTDWIFTYRGSERVLEAFCELYPNADLFALFGSKKNFKSIPSIYNKKIKFSALNNLPFIKHYYRYTYFLWPFFIEQFDFRDYDLVISISSSVAKGVITGINTKHVAFINSPMRYAWDLKDQYFFKENIFSKWKQLVIPFFLHFLRIWDTSSNKFDLVIANSKFIKKRIKKYWGINNVEIVYPYVSINSIELSKSNDKFIYFGALEPNKGVLELMKYVSQSNTKLDIFGDGSLKGKVINYSKKFNNIEYKGYLNEENKFKIISKYKAFIFPGIEDFGIVGLEALSVGVPIVVLEESGVSEFVNDKNGVLINNNSISEIDRAVKLIENMKYNRKDIIQSIEGHTKENFKREIENHINAILE